MPSSDPKGITRLEGEDQRGQPMRGDGDNQGRRGMINGANQGRKGGRRLVGPTHVQRHKCDRWDQPACGDAYDYGRGMSGP